MAQPRMRISATVLNSPDARELAAFYRRLLGWSPVVDKPDWVKLEPPGGGTGLSFQSQRDYVPPVWPETPGEQHMMMHLDIAVADLEEGVAWATAAGATVHPHQPQKDVRVMLDLAGHPFCLFPGKV